MTGISINESKKNLRLDTFEVNTCGECKAILQEDFGTCEDCNMKLCHECYKANRCSSCRRDKKWE